MKLSEIVISPPPPPSPPKFQFYTMADFARFLNLEPNVVYQWQVKKRIPLKWQKKIEVLTDGKFKASIDDLGE